MSPARFAVIGDPVSHSLSPAMQQAAFCAHGLDVIYKAVRVQTAGLEEFVSAARAGAYQGFNVTVPHKQAILRHLDVLDPTAAQLGAVNTVVRTGNMLVGHNTDPVGFLDALGDSSPEGKAVVFGAGGAARAVVHALLNAGWSLTVVNRTPRMLPALCDGEPVETVLPDHPYAARLVKAADLLVNATPLGMHHLARESPVRREWTPQPNALAMDLVYGRQTQFLTWAKRHACRAMDGLPMLIYQGREAFRLWTGFEPDVDVMRAACSQRLREAELCSAS